MRVLLADGDRRTRRALRLLFQQEPDIELVLSGAVHSPQSLDLITGTRPDIVIIDWDDVQASRAHFTETLEWVPAGVDVLVLCSRPELRSSAMSAGASAFVYKGDPPEALIETLRALLPSAPADISDRR